LLFAALLGASMLFTGMASTGVSPGSYGPDDFFLEIEASDKGHQADIDNNTSPTPEYNKTKHKLDTIDFYVWDAQENQSLIFAHHEKSSGLWEMTYVTVAETEISMLSVSLTGISIYRDSDDNFIYAAGIQSIKLKEKDGTAKNAKLLKFLPCNR